MKMIFRVPIPIFFLAAFVLYFAVAWAIMALRQAQLKKQMQRDQETRDRIARERDEPGYNWQGRALGTDPNAIPEIFRDDPPK